MKQNKFSIGTLTVEARDISPQCSRLEWEGVFMAREPEGLAAYLDAVTRTPAGELIPEVELHLQNFERLSSGMMGWLVRTVFKLREDRRSIRMFCGKRTSFQKVLFEVLQEVVLESKEVPGGTVELHVVP